MSRPLVSLALALLPALALAAGEPARPESRGPDLSHPWTLGSRLPAFEGRNLADRTGGKLALSAFAGRPMLVNLWASWCGPCVSELPGLGRLHGTFGPRGLQVVGVSIDDHVSEAEMVAGDLDLKFTLLFDQTRAASDAWRAASIPASFLYDREGRLVWRHSGVLRFDDPAFVAALEQVVAKP
jgi:peroxiredoxin